MPELPDLCIYARNLRKRLLGREVAWAEVFNRKKVNVTPEAFKLATVGHTIQSIERDGKELFFAMSGGQVFSVHLMLCGRFSIVPMDQVHATFSKIVTLGLSGEEALIISDPRGLCRVTLNPPRTAVPDALSPAFSFAYFTKMIAKYPLMGIKAFLIDQKIVKGIGNAYVDEMLWRAKISPKSTCGKIPQEALEALYDAIGWVLDDAIEHLEDLTPDSIAGEERSFLRVHQPKKKFTDEGEAIQVEEIDKKRTYFTASQRMYL